MNRRQTGATFILLAVCVLMLAHPGLAGAVAEHGGTSSVDGTLEDQKRHPTDPYPVSCAACHKDTAFSPHGGYTNTTDRCWMCHSVHSPRATGGSLLFTETATELCLSCHDGTGGNGVYGLVKARTGADPASGHRSSPLPSINVVPGGSATSGGDRTETAFKGEGGFLSCVDCHSPHGSNVVAPFSAERARVSYSYSSRDKVLSTNLLKIRPNGSDTTATVYGSDWCAGCHRGRHSGGAVLNHPVDSSATTDTPYTYQNLPVNPWLGVMDIATDQSGNVYVPDPGNHRVQKFTSDGAYVTKWSAGTPGNTLVDPRGVTVAGGSVFVTDPQVGYIARYTTAGAYQGRVGTLAFNRDMKVWDYSRQDLGDNYYLTPGGLGTDPGGSLMMLVDTERQVPSVWSPATLRVVAVMGRQVYGAPFAGTGVDDFYEATDIAADTAGNVYVVDSMNNRIKKFNSTGTRLLTWGTVGTGQGQFDRPLSIAVDSSDRVYVTDAGNHRIQRFSATGDFQTSWGSLGAQDGQFRVPRGIAVDAGGHVYVVDAGNDRIQRFSSDGVFETTWGIGGTANGQFDFEPVEVSSLGPWSRTGGSPPVYAGRGFLMADPRTPAQEGHAPICQQCHEDARNVGRLYDGLPLPAGPEMSPDGWQNSQWKWDPPPPVGSGTTERWGPLDVSNPRFQNFPHETANANMLVETNDDLCLNCHAPTRLP